MTTSAFGLLLQHAPTSHVVPLFEQRRMSPAIASFVSQQFYGGELTSEIMQNSTGPSSGGILATSFTIVDTSDLPMRERGERIDLQGSRRSFVIHLRPAAAT
jgi:hypothetical protein